MWLIYNFVLISAVQQSNSVLHISACILTQSVMSNSFHLHGLKAHQIPLSMGFPRQEYWSGLPFPPPGTHTHTHTHIFFSMALYPRILNTALRAIQQDLLFIHSVHNSLHVLTPNFQFISPHPTSLVTTSLFSMSMRLFLLCR